MCRFHSSIVLECAAIDQLVPNQPGWGSVLKCGSAATRLFLSFCLILVRTELQANQDGSPIRCLAEQLPERVSKGKLLLLQRKGD